MSKMEKCPRCPTATIVFPSDTGQYCTSCNLFFPTGMTKEEYERDKENILSPMEEYRIEREQRILERREKARKNPVYRSTRYLEYMREGGASPHTSRLRNNHIYIIRLDNRVINEKGKYRSFPNDEFNDFCSTNSKEFKGCVYVGITQDVSQSKSMPALEVCESRFNQHKEGIRAGRGIVRDYSLTNDFDTCGKELTELYGIESVVNNYPKAGVRNEPLESWVGFMLYKLGYHVWGPHAHRKKHRDKFGDFLGTEDYV